MRALTTLAVATFALAGCGSDSETGTFDREAFIAEVSSWEAVQGVAISESGRSIWVGVMDNGSGRDGYAMSVCEAVRDYSDGDLSAKTITVLDGPKMSISGERVELGKHHCEI